MLWSWWLCWGFSCVCMKCEGRIASECYLFNTAAYSMRLHSCALFGGGKCFMWVVFAFAYHFKEGCIVTLPYTNCSEVDESVCVCASLSWEILLRVHLSCKEKKKIARRDSVTCVSALCHVSCYCSSHAKCFGISFLNTNFVLQTTTFI